MPQELTDAIVGLRMDEAVTLAERMRADGTDPLVIIAESQRGDAGHRPPFRRW